MDMRDLINMYETALSQEEQEKALMNGTQKAVDAIKNLGINYFDPDKYSKDEKVARLSISPTGDANNPVDQYTLGKDQDNITTRNFSSGEKLEELDRFKKCIEGLERLRFASEFGIFTLNKSLTKESAEQVAKLLQDMRNQVDVLSDSLVEER